MYTRIDLNGIRKLNKPLTRIRLINGSIRARKHVPVAVNGACAEIRPALHLGESREFSREPHAKGDARVRGGETVSPLFILGKLANSPKWQTQRTRSDLVSSYVFLATPSQPTGLICIEKGKRR